MDIPTASSSNISLNTTVTRSQEKFFFSQSPCNILIYKRYTLVFQMTEIYFSYVFGLHPQFLAYCFQNPWNFLSPQFLKMFRVIKVKWVSCY